MTKVEEAREQIERAIAMICSDCQSQFGTSEFKPFDRHPVARFGLAALEQAIREEERVLTLAKVRAYHRQGGEIHETWLDKQMRNAGDEGALDKTLRAERVRVLEEIDARMIDKSTSDGYEWRDVIVQMLSEARAEMEKK